MLTHTAGPALHQHSCRNPAHTAGPATPAQLQESSMLGFPQDVPPQTISQLPPPQLQTSCRPTPSQTEDFSDIIFLALLPPASP